MRSRHLISVSISGVVESGTDNLLQLAIDHVELPPCHDIFVIGDCGQENIYADKSVGESTDDQPVALALAEWRLAYPSLR